MQTKSIRIEAVPSLHAALSTLAALRLPFIKALALSKLCRQLAELQQVYLQQLNALAEAHNTKFLPDGSFPMPEDAVQMQALCDALNQLVAEEVSVEFEPIALCAEDIGSQRLSTAEILALDGMITFT
jgi:hypothetical protein